MYVSIKFNHIHSISLSTKEYVTRLALILSDGTTSPVVYQCNGNWVVNDNPVLILTEK